MASLLKMVRRSQPLCSRTVSRTSKSTSSKKLLADGHVIGNPADRCSWYCRLASPGLLSSLPVAQLPVPLSAPCGGWLTTIGPNRCLCAAGCAKPLSGVSASFQFKLQMAIRGIHTPSFFLLSGGLVAASYAVAGFFTPTTNAVVSHVQGN